MLQSEMTRREVLGRGVQLSALAAVFLSGCGGLLGGGGGGGATASVTGSMTIPSGIVETDLSVIGMGQVSPVASGSFGTVIDAAAPSWVLAFHAPTEKVIGMGIFSPTEHNIHLDATSAAVALLFMALDGSALPANGRKELLDLIKGHSATPTLAGEIQILLSSDPFALETASQTLQDAVAAAANQIASAAPHAQSGVAKPMAIKPMMLIEPSNEVDGMTVVQSDFGVAYQVQNSRRRNGLMYTYMVAHVDDQGNRQDITPKLVGDPLEIPATNSLLNLGSGWHPKTSQPVALKIDGSDKKTIYELIAFNTVFGANDPSIYEVEKYAGEVDKWKQSVQDLHATMVLSYLAGIMFDAIGIGGLTWGIGDLTATITALSPVSNGLVSLLVGAQNGYKLIPLTKQAIQIFLTGDIISAQGMQVFAPLLKRAEPQVAKDIANGKANTKVYRAMRSALRIFLAVGVIGLAADLVAVAKDTSEGERSDLFTVTLFEPKVGISPASGNYSPGNDLLIQAEVPGVPQSHLSYHWKLSGSNLANLNDGTNVGLDLVSTSNTVTLGTTPSTQGTLTVSVTVTDTTTSQVLGSATASYATGVVQNYTYILQPFGPEAGYPQGGGVAVGYIPVVLTNSQQFVKVTGTNHAGISIEYKMKLPAKSAVIDHTTKPVSSQLIGGNLAVINGTITGLHYVNPNETNEGLFIIWWNYGDEAWLIANTRNWDNRGPVGGDFGNSADALDAVKASLVPWTITVTPA